eukprot:9495954-Pyramimonas_sp.AAC.1
MFLTEASKRNNGHWRNWQEMRWAGPGRHGQIQELGLAQVHHGQPNKRIESRTPQTLAEWV